MPDLTSDLFIDLDARDLAFDDGQEITSMVAAGDGSVRDRTFDVKRSDFGWPTFATGLGGLPAIRFDGTEMISNGGTDDGFPAQRNGPMTLAMVARINAYPAAAHPQRLVTGARPEATNAWNAIQPSTTPAGAVPRIAALEWNTAQGGGAGGNDYGYFTPPDPNGWFASVVVFDGPRSFAKFFGGVEAQTRWRSAPYQGFSFGIRQTVTNPGGGALSFDMRKFVAFTRAFTRDEIIGQHALMKDDWGVVQ